MTSEWNWVHENYLSGIVNGHRVTVFSPYGFGHELWYWECGNYSRGYFKSAIAAQDDANKNIPLTLNWRFVAKSQLAAIAVMEFLGVMLTISVFVTAHDQGITINVATVLAGSLCLMLLLNSIMVYLLAHYPYSTCPRVVIDLWLDKVSPVQFTSIGQWKTARPQSERPTQGSQFDHE